MVQSDELMSASDHGWRSLHRTARTFLHRGEHAKAADILRMLIIAVPGEPDIWDALADCHDAENQPDVGETLRSLGRIAAAQLQKESSPS